MMCQLLNMKLYEQVIEKWITFIQYYFFGFYKKEEKKQVEKQANKTNTTISRGIVIGHKYRYP